MIKIYVHNSIDDIYTIMVTENNYPVASDSVRGRLKLNDELDKLTDEFRNRNMSVKLVGIDNVEDLIIYNRNTF